MRTSTLILIALGLLFTVQAATQDGAFIIDRSNTIVTLRHGGEWLSCPDLNCRWYRTNSVSEMEDRGWSVITNSQDLQNLDSMVAAGSQGNLFIGYRDLQSDNIPDLDANFPPFNSINSNPQAFAYYNLGGQEVTSGTDTSTGEVPPEAGAENDAPASSAGLPPINAPGASSSAPTQGTAMPNTAARDFIDAIFDGRVDNSIGPVIGKPGVFYTLDRAQEVYFKVDGDQITWLDPQTLAPTGVVTTLAAIEGAQGTIARYSATTTRTVGKGRNAVEFVLNFDPDASGSAAAIEFAQGMVTDVQEREGRLIVRIAADNGKAEYVYNANANRFERADGSGAVEMAQQGSTKYTVVTEYGANRASPQDDRVSITLPDGRILRGQAYSGGELRDGDRTIATFSANGRIETDFLDGNTNKPKTIYDPGHPNVVFAVRYDNKGKVMD
ncbi:MAG TPA: hypothetical protein VJK52_00635, partial [Candidatus Nanoarchaeia archaeon]|nr:hypothetical protein [Candidatus Nanoarchaeia archaeon]